MVHPGIPLRIRLGLLCVLTVSIAFHVIYLSELRAGPLGEVLLVDALGYHQKAIAILERGIIPEDPFFVSPLYPFFLALIYKLFGTQVIAVQIVQIYLSVINNVLIFYLGKRLFDDRTALLGAVLACGYGIFVYYSGLLLKVTLLVFLVCLLLLALLEAARRPRARMFCLSGLLLGFAIALRGNFYLLIVGVLAWIGLFTSGIRTKCCLSASFLIGVLISVAPFAWMNYRAGAEGILTESSAGINFYIGNAPGASGRFTNFEFLRSNPKYEKHDWKLEAERRSGRTLSDSQVSWFWFRESAKFMVDNPATFLGLFGKKILLFINHYEIPNDYDFNFMKTQAPVLNWAGVSYGIVLALALCGMGLFRWRGPLFGMVYTYLATYTLSVVMFFVVSRYRVPLVPALLPLAAQTLLKGYARVKELTPRRRGVLAGAMLVLGLGIAGSVTPPDPAFPYIQVGVALTQEGKIGMALNQFDRALQLNSQDSMAYFHRGIAHEQLEDFSAAERDFHAAVDLDPKFAQARVMIGRLLMRSEKWEEAERNLMAAIEAKPSLVEGYLNLGILFARTHRFSEAERQFNRAEQLDPYHSGVQYNLGVLYWKSKDFPRARVHFNRARNLEFPLPLPIMAFLGQK